MLKASCCLKVEDDKPIDCVLTCRHASDEEDALTRVIEDPDFLGKVG